MLKLPSCLADILEGRGELLIFLRVGGGGGGYIPDSLLLTELNFEQRKIY